MPRKLSKFFFEDDDLGQPELPLSGQSYPDVGAFVLADLQQWRAGLEKQRGKAIDDHEIINFGVENSQYFRGLGTSHTNYDEAFVGIGDNAYEALDDALDSAAQAGWDTSSIKNNYNPNTPTEIPEDSEDTYHYIGVRVKGLEPFEPESAPQQESEEDEMLAYMEPHIAKITTNRKLKVGEEVSNNTFSAVDLLRRGLAKLEEIHYDGWKKFVAHNSEQVELLGRVGELEGSEASEAYESLEPLWDNLSELFSDFYCPAFTFFGSHYGCGSCFGCWPSEDYLNDEVREENVVKWLKGDDKFPERCSPTNGKPCWAVSKSGRQAMYDKDGNLLWVY